jgi:antitoxin component YwqK of YwqJK toxin-antitoxin module
MYCNGVLHGAYADWHERGHVWMQGNYRNGNKHGMWRTSYPTGELKDEVEYRGGKFHGTDKYWSRDGALVHERRWVDGALVEAD